MASREEIDAAHGLWRDGRHDEALARLAELDSTADDDERRIGIASLRGQWLEQLGRHAEALAEFRRSVAIRPTYPDTYNAGNVLLHLGDLDAAIEAYDHSIALYDAYPQAWVNRGIALFRSRRHPDARESFERALALDADFLPALNCQVVLARAEGRTEDVEAHLAHIARLRPDDPNAAFALAQALGSLPPDNHIDLSPHGRDWRAIEALNRAIELRPDDPRPWGIKAAVLGRLMHANICFRVMRGTAFEYHRGPLAHDTFFDEQVAHCREAMKRFPDDPWFPNQLADAFEFQGDDDRAEALRVRAREC